MSGGSVGRFAGPNGPAYHVGMKIYTRKGDDGSTALFGGGRVSKASPRVAAYGSVDELNAVLGWVRAAKPGEAIDEVLTVAQDACFRVGAELASNEGADPGVAQVSAEDATRFERAIDDLEADLPALRTFVLPGGCEAASRLHVARTVCRRAEREVVALAAHGVIVRPEVVHWLNRLSDLLFVQARHANHEAGVADVPWNPKP